MTAVQQQAVSKVLEAIQDAIKAGGSLGAPAGVIYSALMGVMNLSTFNAIIDAWVISGKVRKEANLLYWIAK
jgi:hypothetical protein